MSSLVVESGLPIPQFDALVAAGAGVEGSEGAEWIEAKVADNTFVRFYRG